MNDIDFIELTFKKTEVPWLQKGMELLADTGLHKFNIERLSERVGKAKTSYYFLFEDQKNYFRKLALYWAYEGTQRYFDNVANVEDPKKKFELLIEQIYRDIPSGFTWFHLKTMEGQDEYLQQILREVEQHRIKIVGGYFRELGKDPDRSERMARNLMFAIYGWLVLNWKSGTSEMVKKNELSELLSILGLGNLDLDFFDE